MDISPNHSISLNGECVQDRRNSANTHATIENLTPFRAPPQSSTPATPRSVLIQIIEGEIIPRLFLTHCDRISARPVAPAGAEISEHENYDFLADLFLNGENADIVQRLEALLDQGMQREKMYLGLLASVPRRLGGLWEKGLCTFDGMTQGLNRLDQVIQQMHLRERANADSL